MTCCPALPWSSGGPYRPGRFRTEIYRKTRLRHIRCAYLHYVETLTLQQLSRRYRVSTRTITNWVKAALGYSDPEAEGLRRMIDPK